MSSSVSMWSNQSTPSRSASAIPTSMFKLCSTNSSWLHGLWKNALNHVSFHTRDAAWRAFRSASRGTTTTPGSARRRALTGGVAATPSTNR
jgi:hypothetical protein